TGRAVSGPALLSVEGVAVDLPTARGNLRAVDQVDLHLAAGQTLGIVGESGCGKTMLSRAILQLLPKQAKLSGRVMFDGQNLARCSAEALRKLRARSLAVVFQDPMTSLNPVLTIGTQLTETLQEHLELDAPAAKRRSAELLAAVGIPAPEQRLSQYPHQLSGGMRQRVAIAIALSCEPKLLIADEPTTALDVTIQAQILDLLAREQKRRHMAMMIITHDLGVVAGRTDEVAVMYAGRVVERAPTQALFKQMHMPYTEALLAAIPKLETAPHSPAVPPIRPGPSRAARSRRAAVMPPVAARARSHRWRRRRHPPITMPASTRSGLPRARGHDAAGRDIAASQGEESRRRVCRRQQGRPCSLRCQSRDRARRDAGAGRRIRLRQVDPWPRRAAAAAGGIGQGAFRRRGPDGHAGRTAAQDAPPRAAHLSGPDRLAQSAAPDRRDYR